MNNKEVTIKLTGIDNRLPATLHSSITKTIGSKFEKGTTRTLRGIKPEEEEFLLTQILNVSPESLDWEREVDNYFANLVINVPYGSGVKLNITTLGKKDIMFKGTKVSVDIPANIKDYIAYKQCLADSSVGNDLDEALGRNKAFYIEDSNKLKEETFNLNVILDTIQIEFLTLISKFDDNIDIIDALLRKLNSNPSQLEKEDKLLILRNKHKEDVESVKNYKSSDFAKLHKMIKNPDLKIEGFILGCIANNIFSRKGEGLVDSEGTIIGNSLTDAVKFIKDPANSQKVIVYKDVYKKQIVNV